MSKNERPVFKHGKINIFMTIYVVVRMQFALASMTNPGKTIEYGRFAMFAKEKCHPGDNLFYVCIAILKNPRCCLSKSLIKQGSNPFS